MSRLAHIHANCWVPWHKSAETLPGHRWLTTQIELAMREIDPDITLPYWVKIYCKSIIFKVTLIQRYRQKTVSILMSLLFGSI